MKRNNLIAIIALIGLCFIRCVSSPTEYSEKVIYAYVAEYYDQNIKKQYNGKGVITLQYIMLNDTSKIRISSILSTYDLNHFEPVYYIIVKDSIQVIASSGIEKVIVTEEKSKGNLSSSLGRYLENVPVPYNPAVWDLSIVNSRVVKKDEIN